MNTEQENTWRTIQGLKPLQSFRCRIGWHRWTNYEIFTGREYGGIWARCFCAECGMPRIEEPVTSKKKK